MINRVLPTDNSSRWRKGCGKLACLGAERRLNPCFVSEGEVPLSLFTFSSAREEHLTKVPCFDPMSTMAMQILSASQNSVACIFDTSISFNRIRGTVTELDTSRPISAST